MIDLFCQKKEVIDMKEVLKQAIEEIADPLVGGSMLEKKSERTLIIESLSDGKSTNKTSKNVIGDKKPRKHREIRENLLEWKNNDFSMYMSQIYIKKYNDVWQFSLINITMYLDKIKDKLDGVLGFCDNITFKDYIDYFFSVWADDYKKGMLTLKSFIYSTPIRAFASQYNYRERVKEYNQLHEQSAKSAIFVSNKRLREAFLLGSEHFVLEYGLILPINWLVVCDDRELKEAANYVAKAMYSLYQKGRIDDVFTATKKYSPYPKWLFFKDHKILINSLQKKTGNNFSLEIKFTGNKGFSFLRSQNSL